MEITAEIRSKVILEGHAYWRAKAGGRPMPQRGEIDPLLEIPKLVPHIILFDVQSEPLDFRYRLMGSKVRPHVMRDLTGMWMSEIAFQRAPSEIWSIHQRVVESRAPAVVRPPYVGPHQDFLYLEAAIHPLGEESGPVEMLLVFVDFIRDK